MVVVVLARELGLLRKAFEEGLKSLFVQGHSDPSAIWSGWGGSRVRKVEHGREG
jgi:hypothetical protein